MRRSLPFAAVLAVLALAVPVAIAAADDPLLAAYNETVATVGGSTAASLSGADVAVGNGTACATVVCATPREFHFGAASSVAGGVAGGVLSQTLTLCNEGLNCQRGTFRAHVECVTATGNVATLGGTIFQSDFVGLPQAEVGDTVSITVYDNGRNGDPVPDAISFTSLDDPLPETDGQCEVGPYPPRFTVFDGDVMVRDGQF